MDVTLKKTTSSIGSDDEHQASKQAGKDRMNELVIVFVPAAFVTTNVSFYSFIHLK